MHPEVDTAVAGSRDQHRLRSVPRALLPRSLSTHGWHYPDSRTCAGAMLTLAARMEESRSPSGSDGPVLPNTLDTYP